MNDAQLLPVESGLFYTFDFTDMLPATVTVTACVFTCTPTLTLSLQQDNFASAKSTIRVAGGEHGTRYTLQAKATLSNTETVTKDVSLIGFNG